MKRRPAFYKSLIDKITDGEAGVISVDGAFFKKRQRLTISISDCVVLRNGHLPARLCLKSYNAAYSVFENDVEMAGVEKIVGHDRPAGIGGRACAFRKIGESMFLVIVGKAVAGTAASGRGRGLKDITCAALLFQKGQSLVPRLVFIWVIFDYEFCQPVVAIYSLRSEKIEFIYPGVRRMPKIPVWPVINHVADIFQP
jgi:hypothetical protein